MNEADLLLVFGASFSNHTGIYAVQADHPGRLRPDAAREVPPGRPCRCWGDVGVTAGALARRARRRGARPSTSAPSVAERWAIWRAEKARPRADDRGRGVASAAVFAALTRHVPDDAVIAVDVGNNTYSFGRYFECTPARRC